MLTVKAVYRNVECPLLSSVARCYVSVFGHLKTYSRLPRSNAEGETWYLHAV